MKRTAQHYHHILRRKRMFDEDVAADLRETLAGGRHHLLRVSRAHRPRWTGCPPVGDSR